MKSAAYIFLIIFTGSLLLSAPAQEITVRGSDTMLSMTSRFVQAWRESDVEKGNGRSIAVTGGGSGVGIAELSNGSADIATSSRPMKPAEKAKIEAGGRVVKEIIVCYDALGIAVSSDCDLKSISMDQLRGIWMSGDLATWESLGAKKPQGDIALVGRGSNTPEYATFQSILTTPELRGLVTYLTELESDDDIVSTILRTPNAMGFVRPGKVNERIKILPVAPKDGAKPVAPGIKSIADGTYPFRQPLYFYTTKPDAPGMRDFIAFVLSKPGQKIVAEQGFSPLPEEPGPPAKEEK